jgi:cytochrome c oxidase subunit 4
MSAPLSAQLTRGPAGAGAELLIWIVLTALTLATWGLAYVHLGVLQLPVALAIAVAKGSLVAIYFMGLIEQRGTRRLAVPLAIAMLLLLLGLTLFDVGTRFASVNPDPDGPSSIAPERAPRRDVGAPLPHRLPEP